MLALSRLLSIEHGKRRRAFEQQRRHAELAVMPRARHLDDGHLARIFGEQQRMTATIRALPHPPRATALHQQLAFGALTAAQILDGGLADFRGCAARPFRPSRQRSRSRALSRSSHHSRSLLAAATSSARRTAASTWRA